MTLVINGIVLCDEFGVQHTYSHYVCKGVIVVIS